ncbi:uncharacterized protein CEXT_218911 [Caerostris extrusa]|uniref:Uncharacterized protein n=1 Tax=Caerostris extrusa TaxID=172846 RepID=A0AAV4T896_CAEEX|nr:uncharacterized protein CEXT_218911 [Caerostris extrusa]
MKSVTFLGKPEVIIDRLHLIKKPSKLSLRIYLLNNGKLKLLAIESTELASRIKYKQIQLHIDSTHLSSFLLKHSCHKLYRRIELVNQSKPQLFTRVSQVTTGYEWNPKPFVLSPSDKCIRMGSTLPFRGTLVITARAPCGTKYLYSH